MFVGEDSVAVNRKKLAHAIARTAMINSIKLKRIFIKALLRIDQ
jgi:hypothetical protein